MIKFKALWESHPTINGDKNPCSTNGKKNFDDQCAIRVGVALSKCGIDTSTLPGAVHCWHDHPKSLGHVIRAEELAVGLSKRSIAGLEKMVKVKPSEFSEVLEGKTGIIFFKDYWQRTINGVTESFRNRSGDHIDLWNGSRLTDPFSWIRIQARFGALGIHSFRDDLSDFEDAKEVWFWRVV